MSHIFCAAICCVNGRFNVAKKIVVVPKLPWQGYMAGKCSSKFKCRVCRGCHTSLHRLTQPSQQVITPSPMDDTLQSSRVLTPTALVLIKDNFGSFQQARGLLDSGPEINFVTEKLAKRLQLSRVRQQYEIYGIADASAKMKF